MATERNVKILIQILAPNKLVDEILQEFPLHPNGKVKDICPHGSHFTTVSIYLDHYAPHENQLFYLADIQQRIAEQFKHIGGIKVARCVTINIINAPRVAQELLACSEAS